jgi:hypothetical protein
MVNTKSKVLDVQGGRDAVNTNVAAYPRAKGANQKWKILYVDEAKPDPKKGEYVGSAGLYNLRDFYVISSLPSRRRLDRIGNNVVIKTANGRTSQKWYYDYKNRAINSRQNPNYVLHIDGNGARTKVMIAYKAEQWW